MKKFFAILLAAVMMVPGMMGAAMADDMVEITLMLGGMEDFMMDAFQTYWVDPFEAEYPNIKIVLENVPDIEQVTKTQMAAGGGPDMMEIIGPQHGCGIQRASVRSRSLCREVRLEGYYV